MKSTEPDQLSQLPPEARPLKHIASTCEVLVTEPDAGWADGGACRQIFGELRESVLQLMQEDPKAEIGFNLTLPEWVVFRSPKDKLKSAEQIREIMIKVRIYVEERLRNEFGL